MAECAHTFIPAFVGIHANHLWRVLVGLLKAIALTLTLSHA